MTNDKAKHLQAIARESASQILAAGKAGNWVRQSIHLSQWIEQGIFPGGAIGALIDGDMWSFHLHADAEAWENAPKIMIALYGLAPIDSFGRTGAMSDWCEKILMANELVKGTH